MVQSKRFHFIGIGGNVMHDLAIALRQAGHTVTGSDEEFAEGARARLLRYNLLPEGVGWFPERINTGVQGVIIGMRVNRDNPEMRKALDLKLTIYSFPDFVYQFSKDKQRLVVAGSSGKTMITLLIMHVLNFHKREFDYLVGTKVTALENSVRLSNAPLIIIEGQDVMASVLDPTPAFLKYHHHIGVISGIEWQESDIYPTKDDYTKQYGLFEAATPRGGVLIYFDLGPVIAALSKMDRTDVSYIPYKTHPSTHQNGHEFLVTSEMGQQTLKITGKHNLQNISAAKEALKKIGVNAEMFYQAIPSFEGTSH